MNTEKLADLVLTSLEHELGGVKIYTTALTCALNADLKEEWQDYLEQTTRHVQVLESVCSALGVDPGRDTKSRAIVRHVGNALVAAMQLAIEAGDRPAAELVACECVVLAETKDHANWQLLGKAAEHSDGATREALQQAYDEVEDQEDEHLYHTKGWCRELWIQALGLPAVLPPPEEVQRVKTAIGAARAEQAADKERA